MRKRVYIAGPLSRGDLCANINQATVAFVALAKAGCAPFCPHWSVYSKPCESGGYDGAVVRCTGTVQGNPAMNYEEWMAVDLPWVAASDALLRLPGESTGADLEEACARENGIPVFHSVADVVRWAREVDAVAVS